MRRRHPPAPFVYLASLMLGLWALFALFSTQTPSAHAGSPSFVRIIHASPFVGTADVFVDGAKLLSSFAFGAITDYVSVPPGPHKVQIALVGKGIGAAALTQTLAVSPGIAYTVAAIGATPSSLALEVFIDNNQVTSGAAKLRVYHLSPNLGMVNVTTSGNTIVQGITYQQASEYQTIAPGAYTFQVDATQANTTLPISETLKANTVTSIFAVGVVNGSPKVELVPAQASGLPGLPGTGSDPRPIPTGPQPLMPWLLGALVLGVLGTSLLVRRRTGAR